MKISIASDHGGYALKEELSAWLTSLGHQVEDSLIKHLKTKGFSLSEMLEAGKEKKNDRGYYDNFRNRVMTPIIDVRGNVIAFGGRVLDDSKPKYINTGDTLAYKKTNELFALNTL